MNAEELELSLRPKLMKRFEYGIFKYISNILLFDDPVKAYEEIFQIHVICYLDNILNKKIRVCKSFYCYTLTGMFFQDEKDYAVSIVVSVGLYGILQVIDDHFGHKCDLNNEVPVFRSDSDGNDDLDNISAEDFSRMMSDFNNGE